MAENSGISWTDHTFNPWMGCTKVSPACTNCYAERDMDHRLGKVNWGPNGTRVLTTEAYWKKPVLWNQDAAKKGIRYRVFCASLADVFENWDSKVHDCIGRTGFICDQCGNTTFVSYDGSKFWSDGCGESCNHCRLMKLSDIRNRLFKLIDATPNLDWLLLTKKPENILEMWPYVRMLKDGSGKVRFEHYRHNVWLGTSVENEDWARKRVAALLECRRLSPCLFVSSEPLLGPLDFTRVTCRYDLCNTYNALDPTDDYNVLDPTAPNEGVRIDWVIAGGESGPNARPSHPDWFRSLRDQCRAADVPFHFKQWGEFAPEEHESITMAMDHQKRLPWADSNDLTPMYRIGTKQAGRLLDGVQHDAFPEVKHA